MRFDNDANQDGTFGVIYKPLIVRDWTVLIPVPHLLLQMPNSFYLQIFINCNCDGHNSVNIVDQKLFAE